MKMEPMECSDGVVNAGTTTSAADYSPDFYSPDFDSPMPPIMEDVDSRGTSYGRPPLKSKAWAHFTRAKDGDPNSPKASCNYCGRSYKCHSKKQGTSSMLHHLTICKHYRARQSRLAASKSKLICELKKDGDSTTASLAIDKCVEKKIRAAIARMIIVDGLPFRFVEGQGFRDFMRTIDSKFPIPSCFTVMRDCVKLYLLEKEKLRNLFTTSGQRVCLTTSMWTSTQNLNYICITGHFIGNDWKLNRRIMNFCKVPNYEGVTIGRVIESCLLDFGIDNIFTITVDSTTSNDTAIDYIRRRTKYKVGTILDNEFIHMRCCAHSLNLIMTEGVKDVNESIVKVRNAVAYVKSTPSRFDKFKSCVEMQKIQSKGLCLDVPNRWNSTSMMLDVAEKCQSAFELLQESDGQFVHHLSGDERGRPGLGPPDCNDWDNVRVTVKFLKIFYDVALRISGSLHANSHLYFHELSVVHQHLQALCESSDNLLQSMAERFKANFEKYWVDFEKVNLMLFVAAVLDPRYKLDALEFWFTEVVGIEQATELVAKLRRVIDRLYDQYTKFGGDICGVELSGAEPQSSSISINSSKQGFLNFMSRYYKIRTSQNNVECKSELDQYLTDDIEAPNENFDILNWWKLKSTKYPILAQIAKLVLAVPISTIDSESSLSTNGQVLDHFRSSLSPTTVEAIICAQNWLKEAPPIGYDTRDVMVDAESYKLESEISLRNILHDDD
ncbi:hypothetical protein I3842_13G090600 [Carya illinoinensis]|uniref:BED-type domain-containing protein n=1 Tax=Carya illinoinensis TaxID=32201 RepID=A0A922AIT0_CARIL|nr:hypothetical protein I3842_13G090600 [Carya illinoinensis]